MLEGYFDESGTHKGSLATCVAGYLFTKDGCRRFNKQWQRALDRAGLKYFHASDAANPKSALRRLPPKTELQLSISLNAAIKRNALVGLGVTLSQDDFNRLAPPAWQKTFGAPYTTCVLFAVRAIGKWMRKAKRPDGPVAYIFESGAEHMKQAGAKMADIATGPEDVREFLAYGSHGFVPKDGALALQAADRLAAEWVKNFKAWTVGAPIRKSLQDLISVPQQHELYWLRERHLKRLFADNPVP